MTPDTLPAPAANAANLLALPAGGACANLAGELCLPCGLARLEARRGGSHCTTRRIRRGDSLYRQGDDFRSIYAVRAGSFKTVLQDADGLEQVASFELAGEILGLDGMARGRHAATATALEDSEILVLPLDDTRWWEGARADLQGAMVQLLGREMLKDRFRLRLITNRSADQRVAALLLDMSRRMRARGYSDTEFHLRLSRQEMGSYLGLKLETVSRALGALQQQRLLAIEARHVRLFDVRGLQQLAGTADE